MLQRGFVRFIGISKGVRPNPSNPPPTRLCHVIVIDVQLSVWQPRSCSTDGIKNALLISHFIKFNPLFFQKYYSKLKNGRNGTLLDCLMNQYNKNETFIFKKYQNSLKSKVPMPPSELLVMPPFDFLAMLELQRLYQAKITEKSKQNYSCKQTFP